MRLYYAMHYGMVFRLPEVGALVMIVSTPEASDHVTVLVLNDWRHQVVGIRIASQKWELKWA